MSDSTVPTPSAASGFTFLNPASWPQPRGYSNGIKARGEMVFVGGMVGWDARQRFPKGFLAQTEQLLNNIVAVLKEAGGEARHICRMTAYCCDKPAYMAARRQLGAIWRELIGNHYPAMSMIFVVDLLDNPGKIELEATAVRPRRGRREPAVVRACHE